MNNKWQQTGDKMNYPQISVIILTHNSFRYLLESIDSILEQTYNNIQLIISDDNSASFPAEALINRLTVKRTSNLEQIIVHETEYSKGKIQQLSEVFHRYCNGKYVMFMDAGDVFYSKTTLEELIRVFQKDGENIDAVLSQAKLYDEWMLHFKRDSLTQEAIHAVQDNKAYNLVHNSPVLIRLPLASMIIKKDWLELNIEGLKSYKECASLALQLALLKEGMHIKYSNIISIKHQDEEFRKMLTQSEYKYYLLVRQEQISCIKTFLKSENLEINEEFSKIIQQHDDEISKENIVLNKIKMFKRNTVSPQERWINLLKRHKDTLYQYSREKYIVCALSCFIYILMINIAVYKLPLSYVHVLLGISLLLIFFITLSMFIFYLIFKYRK